MCTNTILAMKDNEEAQTDGVQQRVLPMPVMAVPITRNIPSPRPSSSRRHSYVVTLDSSSIKVDEENGPQDTETSNHPTEEKRHSLRIVVPDQATMVNATHSSASASTSESNESNRSSSTSSKGSGDACEFDFDLPDALSRMEKAQLNDVLDDIVHKASISTFGAENPYYSRKLKHALLKDVAHIQQNSQAYSSASKDDALHNTSQDKSADIIRSAVIRRVTSKNNLLASATNHEGAHPTSLVLPQNDNDKLNKEWVLEKLNEHEQKMHAQLKSERFKKYVGYTISVLSTVGGIAAALITYYSQQKPSCDS